MFESVWGPSHAHVCERVHDSETCACASPGDCISIASYAPLSRYDPRHHIRIGFGRANCTQLLAALSAYLDLTDMQSQPQPPTMREAQLRDVVTCDVCGEVTADNERLTNENWEFCSGLAKQFCGTCREGRVLPACDDVQCQADRCYSAHHDFDPITLCLLQEEHP